MRLLLGLHDESTHWTIDNFPNLKTDDIDRRLEEIADASVREGPGQLLDLAEEGMRHLGQQEGWSAEELEQRIADMRGAVAADTAHEEEYVRELKAQQVLWQPQLQGRTLRTVPMSSKQVEAVLARLQDPTRDVYK